MSAWLGTRDLTTADGKRIEVAIGIPRFVEKLHWECDLRFTVDGVEKLERAPGADAFQALQGAFFVAWRDAEEMGAVWAPLEADSGFFRTLMTSEASHFDVPKVHAMIDAELARQEQEASDFYEARERANAEGVAPPPWPPRLKAWRDALDAARNNEKRERRLEWERNADSPDARAMIASARDAAEAISEGMNCLHAVADGTALDVDPCVPRKLMYALVAVKSGRFYAGDFVVADDLLYAVDQLQRLAPWGASPQFVRDLVKTLAKHIVEMLSNKAPSSADPR